MRKLSWILLLLMTGSLWVTEGERAEIHAPVATNVKAEQVNFEHVLIHYDMENGCVKLTVETFLFHTSFATCTSK